MTRRRTVIRPPSESNTSQNQAKIEKLNQRLKKERAALSRWLSKLKRAFHAFEKQQDTINRLEKELAKLAE